MMNELNFTLNELLIFHHYFKNKAGRVETGLLYYSQVVLRSPGVRSHNTAAHWPGLG